MSWQPTATMDALARRAQMIQQVRSFFAARSVLEVDVPVIGRATVTDLNLDSLCVTHAVGSAGSTLSGYLQTSPEFFMKRLLAAGSGDIYYLGKAFRADESGRIHNPEFTMLEWYRCAMDDRALSDEVVSLCRAIQPSVDVVVTEYGAVFEQHTGLNPHTCSTETLADYARAHLGVDWFDEPRGLWLDLLFTHCVEPQLGDGLVVIRDFPACQCALARVVPDETGVPVARRFEVYWGGIELANGYWELVDAQEQRARFMQDNKARVAQGKPEIALDNDFLAALDAGLPECAGVALGIDRLLMCASGCSQIGEVMSFHGTSRCD
ncbi:EF-P lysine aminoacylase EpmA [Teredinibacter turnerae]|uniref:EF-P lysine aminoacylase EpmA n=1 Tax=Teredinibacter turnerae TaxID=2426 RepID=UPI00037AB218|nr:EF-P lysine aminoacylase EpmA [Teredinibacter turnerae]